MFSNRFNTRNDPLLEAVEGAMKDGALRRQAEALVNEEFGVYSRKAVVREELAAYDATLEEVYGALKEGVQIDEISGSLAGKYMTKAREQKKEIQGKINKDEHTKKDFQKGLRRTRGLEMARDKLTGRGQAKVHTTEELAKITGPKVAATNEDLATAMTLGGLAGTAAAPLVAKGVNKVMSHLEKKRMKKYSDERKAKKSVKEELAKKDYDKDGKIESPKDEVWGSRLRAAKMAGKLKEGTAEAETSMSVTKDNKPSTPAQTNASTSGPSSSDKAALTSKIKSMQEAAYSAKAARAGKDIGKPGKMFKKIAAKAGERYGSEERGKKVAGAILKRIRAKHMEEQSQIDEIVVQKSQMKPGETLGMAMNRLTGKTAIKGGANDPTSPSFKSGKLQGPPMSASSSAAPVKPADSHIGGKTQHWKDMGSVERAKEPATQASTIKASGGTPSVQTGTAAPKTAPLPTSRPASLGGSVPTISAPSTPAKTMTDAGRASMGMPKSDASAGVKKLMSMSESVQVGANKYRIV